MSVRPDEPPGVAPSSWLDEARRKAIHIGCLLLPLGMLYEWLPWPRGKAEWRWFSIALALTALLIDLVRIHERRVQRLFRDFFGGMIREHERFNLLGSTYLLIAALLALEMFPQPVAAASLGFAVFGDGIAGLAGRTFGRTRFFGKTLEGAAAGLAACLAWAAFVAWSGHLTWNVALAGALVASLVEFLPIPLDDNLGVPLVSGYVMKLLGMPT